MAPGAFRKSLGRDDVRLLVNHDANLLLARSTSGTLRLREDSIGLLTEAELDLGQTYAADLAIAMRRGDLDGMSFAFELVQDQWEVLKDGTDLRTLLEVKLWDVSAVTYPAYPTSNDAKVGEDIGDRFDRRVRLEAMRRRHRLRELQMKHDIRPTAPARRVSLEAMRRDLRLRELQMKHNIPTSSARRERVKGES